jgi:hypothetical protein
MRTADGALYRAKESGRSSVVSAPAVEHEGTADVRRPTPIARRRTGGEKRTAEGG